MTRLLRLSNDILSDGEKPFAIEWEAWPATVWLTWRGGVVASLLRSEYLGLYTNGITASLELAHFENGYVGWAGSFTFYPFLEGGDLVTIEIGRAYDVVADSGAAITGPYTRLSPASVFVYDSFGVLQEVDCTGAIRVHPTNPAL